MSKSAFNHASAEYKWQQWCIQC